jgi:hypothetical protein
MLISVGKFPLITPSAIMAITAKPLHQTRTDRLCNVMMAVVDPMIIKAKIA